MENLLVRCIPGVIDCVEEVSSIPGGRKMTAAPILQGIIALVNTVVPPILWFSKFKYNTPSTEFDNYKNTYWALVAILYYMTWFLFWVLHPVIFFVPLIIFPLTFFKMEKLNRYYVEIFNFAWYAISALYPLFLVVFFFATSPYFLKTDLERIQEGFGTRNEDVSFYMYWSIIFINCVVQIGYNRQLNEWYYGKYEVECDYYIDGYCKKLEEKSENITEEAEEFVITDWFDF